MKEKELVWSEHLQPTRQNTGRVNIHKKIATTNMPISQIRKMNLKVVKLFKLQTDQVGI